MERFLIVKVFVYDFGRSYIFDVYEDIRTITGKKRISAQLFSAIESHKSDKVDVYSDAGINFFSMQEF
jgi:hypothetical protein